jgi:lipopolysaccharide export system permease protein
MRLLDRYLLRELLIPLGYCLGGILLFWISADLFAKLRDFQERKLLALDIAQYYLVTTPRTLVLVFPVALLLALLYALTNHARHQEITAIRAAGVSLWRLCLPYLCVGFAATLGIFAINELLVPDSSDLADQILERRQKAAAAANPGNIVRGFSFYNASQARKWNMDLYNLDTTEMVNPRVIWDLPGGVRVWLFANPGRAVYADGAWCFTGNVQEFRDQASVGTPATPYLVTNDLRIPFSETPEEIRSEIRIAGKLSGLFEAREADIPVTDLLNYLRLHPKLSDGGGASWLRTKLHGRLAIPWTCLVVVLISVPFGLASGRRNVFVGVAASIFICFLYFFLQQMMLPLGAGGRVPPWVAGWLPNLTFGLAGIIMTGRVR